MAKHVFNNLAASKPVCLVTIISFLLTHTLVGQNTQQYLNDGYLNYMEFSDAFKNRPTPVTKTLVQYMTQKAEAAMTLFNKVVDEGITEQKLAATYYSTLILSQHGQIVYELGAYNVAASDFNRCEENISKLVSDIFPLKFIVQGEHMIVEFKEFESIRNNHYYYSGLLYFKERKMKESVARLAEMIYKDNVPKENRFIAYNCFVFAQVAEPSLFLKEQQSNNALGLIKSNTPVTSYYGKKVFDEKTLLKSSDAALRLFELGSETDASVTTLVHCAEAAIYLSATEPVSKTVLNLYELCLKKPRSYTSSSYGGDRITSNTFLDFCKTADAYARTMVGIDKPKAEFVGLTAIESISEYAEIMGKYGTQKKLAYPKKYELLIYCANAFSFWNKPDKETKMRALAKECYDNMSKNQRKEVGQD